MKISPNTQIVIGAIVAVLTVLANGTVNMPMGIPAEWGQYFVSWDKFLLETSRAALVETICTRRQSWWHSLSNFWRFGKGWSARGDGIETKALRMLATT